VLYTRQDRIEKSFISAFAESREPYMILATNPIRSPMISRERGQYMTPCRREKAQLKSISSDVSTTISGIGALDANQLKTVLSRSYCCTVWSAIGIIMSSVRLSVRLSITLCILALRVSVYRGKSCISVFLAGMFLFVPSDSFAVG